MTGPKRSILSPKFPIRAKLFFPRPERPTLRICNPPKVVILSAVPRCVPGSVLCPWGCAVSLGLCCVPGSVLCPWVCAVSLGLCCVPGSVLCPWVCAVSLGMWYVPGYMWYVPGYVVCPWVCGMSLGMWCVPGMGCVLEAVPIPPLAFGSTLPGEGG